MIPPANGARLLESAGFPTRRREARFTTEDRDRATPLALEKRRVARLGNAKIPGA